MARAGSSTSRAIPATLARDAEVLVHTQGFRLVAAGPWPTCFSAHGARREHYTFRKGGGSHERNARAAPVSVAGGSPRRRSTNLSVKANSKSPEVENRDHRDQERASANCDARVDFGDGPPGRSVDFGVATVRSLKYTYAKGGNYKVSVKGAGKTAVRGGARAKSP